MARFAFFNVYCRIEYGHYELDRSNRHASVTDLVKYYLMLGGSIE